jgi:hypothetical protein
MSSYDPYEHGVAVEKLQSVMLNSIQRVVKSKDSS